MAILAPSILITDDDLAFRQTLQTVFEPHGFRTLTAGDGEEAVRIVQREEVHLVLLDMHMPKLTGVETIRQLKQLKAVLPCILMSAHLGRVHCRAGSDRSCFLGPRQAHVATRDNRRCLHCLGADLQLATRPALSATSSHRLICRQDTSSTVTFTGLSCLIFCLAICRFYPRRTFDRTLRTGHDLGTG